MKHPQSAWVVGTVLVFCSALAACDSSGGEASTQAESAGAGPVPTDEPELLARYEQLLGRSAEDERQRHEAFEDGVAMCMKEAGFEYIPVPFVEYQSDTVDPMLQPEYREQWGYGISTNPPRETGNVNPNTDYVASLGEQAKSEYEIALDGDMTLTAETGGCKGKVYHEIETPLLPTSDLMNSVNDEIREVYDETVSRDPRVVQAMSNTKDCMADAGLAEYASNEVYAGEILSNEWEELQASNPSETQVEEFQALEREVAVAEMACWSEVSEAKAEVYREVQEQVLEKYRSEIEAYLAEAEASLAPTPAAGPS